jgi:regulator of protease activity HflC (stomatin/prohibitin superfamily)
MKKLVIVLSLVLMTACDNVPVGNVGILVHKLGGAKGVDSEELGVGRVWLGINDELFIFPTFTQNHVWTKDKSEGSPNDDSFTFQTKEGLNVNTDVGIAYHIDPTKITTVFQRYRKGADEITNSVLRNTVRDAFNKSASNVDIESVYGAGKAALMESVLKRVTDEMKPIGIEVENIFLVGNMRLPETVVEAINAKIGATQKAAQRENEVAQAKAEADKAIETARGEAQSKLAIAKAEAEAIQLKGNALKDNPKLADLAAIEKWNGELPQYMLSGSTPFINLNK